MRLPAPVLPGMDRRHAAPPPSLPRLRAASGGRRRPGPCPFRAAGRLYRATGSRPVLDLWMVGLAASAAALGSIVGLGGGVIIVPVLTLAGIPPPIAATNSLFAVLANSSSSTLSYYRQKRINYREGIMLGLMAVPGIAVGALLSSDMSPDTFKFFFAMVIVASAAYMLLRRGVRRAGRQRRAGLVMVLAAGASFFAGVLSSLFGVGGGVVFMPLLVVVVGMAAWRAAPTSQFILLFVSSSSLAAHALLGDMNLTHALYMLGGAFAGGMAGARLSKRVKDTYLRVLVAGVLFVVAAKIFLGTYDVVLGNAAAAASVAAAAAVHP